MLWQLDAAQKVVGLVTNVGLIWKGKESVNVEIILEGKGSSVG